MAMKRMSGNLLSRRACRLLGLVWALATASLLLLPGSQLPGEGISEPWITSVELLIHLVLFWVLAWLAGRGFVDRSAPAGEGSAWRARRRRVLAVVLAYCVVLEIAQIAVPGRGFEWLDIAVGGLGAVLGLLASS